MNARPDIAEGKSCGDGGLCCKPIGVESISKPQFVWCKSYRKGVGCKVYDDRPSDCRVFVSARRRRAAGRPALDYSAAWLSSEGRT
jgi:Fe-S-cluster containining protein